MGFAELDGYNKEHIPVCNLLRLDVVAFSHTTLIVTSSFLHILTAVMVHLQLEVVMVM